MRLKVHVVGNPSLRTGPKKTSKLLTFTSLSAAGPCRCASSRAKYTREEPQQRAEPPQADNA